eukprot:PITA_01389
MAGLIDPLTSKLLDKAFTEMGKVANIIFFSKTWGKELKNMLLLLKPTIDEISKRISESDLSPDRGKQFKGFQADLQDGLRLVENLEKIHSFDIFRKYRYGKKVLKFQRKVYDFLLIQGPPNVTLDLQKLSEDIRDLCQRFRPFERLIENVRMTTNPISNSLVLQKIETIQVFQNPIDAMPETSVICTYQAPDMPNFVVGLNNPINALKKILLQNGVNIVGVTGMGGSGKTTLASMLCNDTQVQYFFQNNIVFITVSQFPNVKGLLDTMWDKIIGPHRPDFQSIEDAHNQLQKNLILKVHHPTLVVLDDVWSGPNVDQLLFEAKGYKTVITTRQNSTIPKRSDARLYSMPMLEDGNALSLFCFWAFNQTSVPATEKEDLIKQIVAESKGLPLALKVIGSCLHGEPQPVWESAKAKLSRGEHISDYHRDNLINRLEMSIDVLDNEQKQCFLDLGAFPKGRKLSVDLLLDIWVYVHGMEWQDAFVILLELAKRNLLNLTSDPGSPAISCNCSLELSFSQHDIMRDLACGLTRQDSKRLFMPHKETKITTECLRTLKDKSSEARFLSFHTDSMQEQDWCPIDFPQVEALVLFFAASQYCLPKFLQTMPKLKVLIIYNYSSKRAVLQGLQCFGSHTQIKSVLFEKLIVFPLYEYCRSWENLEKLSVCLCEGFRNMTLLDREHLLKFPKIVDINLDHCSDMEEFPWKICNLTSLQRLSVTNCHLIQKLPDDMGRLRSLTVLRLSACPSLSMLPPSICKLEQLEFLDISACRCLKDFPMEFGQLSNLKMLDMKECSGLKKLPKTLAKLRSLSRVICDENMERHWRSIKASAMPTLTIDVVEECFNLDWLDA